MTTLSKSAIWTFIIWISCYVPSVARAENHALLIGIDNYKQKTLEGPSYDVKALSKVLLEQYDFKRKNVHTLVNKEAVKSRILSDLRQLTKKTHSGDRVFIYFSGHGTSRRDEQLALPLPHQSGALVPADFDGNPNKSIQEQMSQLIIGKRDLRPILAQLDQDRQVLVVFDTCFSGNTVRAIGNRKLDGVSRFMPLRSRSVFDEEQNIGSFVENLKPDEPYPYQNTFYISASSENEIAQDIRKDMLYLFPTIDGNPHGVLTDALLRVLAGQTLVDTDNDGKWSQIELYTALRSEVQRRFKQTPLALPKKGDNADRLYARSFFVRSAGRVSTAAEMPQGSRQGIYLPEYSSSHALVIGIDKYRLWPHLEYAVKDAKEMGALLSKKGFQLDMLTNEKATKKNILRKLDSIRRSVDVNSRVVFYFAGHGLTEDLPGGRERGYIVPVDADAYDWKGTMLSMNQLKHIIKQIKSKPSISFWHLIPVTPGWD